MAIRFDAVKSFAEQTCGRHLDANETLFFARELESVEARAYEFKERELKHRKYVPVSNRDNPGAESVTYRMYGRVGMARIVGNYSQDLPRSDVYGKEYTQAVKTIGVSCGWNTQEIRAALFANKPLDTMKMDACRRSMNEKQNSLVWTGDTEYNIIGLLNNPNIPTLAAASGIAGTTPWSTKTPDEIITDIQAHTTLIQTQSKDIHEGDTLLLPRDQYDIIAKYPRSTHSDMTILEYITKPGNSFGLTTVDVLTELELAFTGGTEDGALCYERSEEVLEQRIPLEMQLLPMQARNLEFIIPTESRHGGVVVRYPLAMVFLTGI